MIKEVASQAQFRKTTVDQGLPTMVSKATAGCPFPAAWFRLAALLFLIGCLFPADLASQNRSTPDAATVVEQARRSVAEVRSGLDRDGGTAALTALQTQAADAQAQADAAAGALAPRLAAARRLLDELGKPAPGVAETPEIQARRKALATDVEDADADQRGARLVAAEAAQLVEEIAQERRSRFNARLLERSHSPLEPGLWYAVGTNLGRDGAKLQALWNAVAADLTDLTGAQATLLGLEGVFALVLIVPLWRRIEHAGRRRGLEAPGSRLRKSGSAAWTLLFGSAVPVLLATALFWSLQWADPLSTTTAQLGRTLIGAVALAAVVMAVTRALLAPGRQSWRLAPFGDETVSRLRFYPPAAALLLATGLLWSGIIRTAGVSFSLGVLWQALLALAYASLAGAFLLRMARRRRRKLGAALDEPDADPVKSSATSVIALVATVAVLATLVAVASGYIALGIALARQVLWTALVAGIAWILLRFVDDLFTSFLNSGSRFGRSAYLSLGVRPTTIDQMGVLLSALVRIILAFIAIGVVVAPFGADPTALFSRLGRSAAGFSIGEVTISPRAIFRAVLVFVVGAALVRLLRGWLDKSYLPKTALDPGLRNSVSTAVGYLGLVLAGMWAFAALGIGMERLALVASALSVGIGFGLQAIVQNFISGLIMLAERPVNVGDWVVVGDQEGDVRRISVRATEIRLQDRSMLLVPNSEFITKAVRNKTLGGTIGRLNFKLGVNHDADPAAVRRILAEVVADDAHVLDHPEPAVLLDEVVDSGIRFSVFAYVSDPRDAASIRSGLLFEVLKRLREGGIALARPQQDVRVLGPSRDGSP